MDEATFDLNNMIVSNKVVSMHQDGNFLVCVTDTGQKFRHAIPVGKILNKHGEEWALEDLNLRG